MKLSSILSVSLAAALLLSCSGRNPTSTGSSARHLEGTKARKVQDHRDDSQLAGRWSFRHLASRVLPWNASPATRFQPAGFEQVARGPSALCLDSEGRPLILNPLARTLVRLDAGLRGQRKVSDAPPDAEDLTCAEGRIVLFSPLRSSVQVLSESGRLETTLQIPRALRRPLSVDLRDGDLWLTTALQESWRVTRSLEPLPLAAIQRTKQEGFFLPDGKAVQVVVRDGRGQILLLDQDAGRVGRVSEHVVRRISLPHALDGARVLGAEVHGLCLLAERRRQDARGAIRVSRSLDCIDLQSGTIQASLALPDPGIYAPRRWVAMRDGFLVTMVPRNKGLALDLWKLEVLR